MVIADCKLYQGTSIPLFPRPGEMPRSSLFQRSWLWSSRSWRVWLGPVSSYAKLGKSTRSCTMSCLSCIERKIPTRRKITGRKSKTGWSFNSKRPPTRKMKMRTTMMFPSRVSMVTLTIDRMRFPCPPSSVCWDRLRSDTDFSKLHSPSSHQKWWSWSSFSVSKAIGKFLSDLCTSIAFSFRKVALAALRFSSQSIDMKAPLANLTLLWYHCIIQPFFAIDMSNPPGLKKWRFERLNHRCCCLCRYEWSEGNSQTQSGQIWQIHVVHLLSRTSRSHWGS